ncbi:hypothetical protein [Rathayibacter festucae]|uniref:hypothetical protein n=1 Tax=Rathayibacter festucae TaxID=110937 RepID=UPI001FC9509C|nr:hypothetical protein [Rathayibacter festucae]
MVDTIVVRGAVGTIVQLAVVIAVVAAADAGVSRVTRWYSARIGEGVILDLRTAVCNHVEKMPIAFFPAPSRANSPAEGESGPAEREGSGTPLRWRSRCSQRARK